MCLYQTTERESYKSNELRTRTINAADLINQWSNYRIVYEGAVKYGER